MAQLYQIDNYIVDVARNQVIRDQHSINEFIQTLPPKTIMVLTELVNSQGQVVNHEQLMNSVWPNTVVSPNSIQRCITQLRKALTDDSKQQLIIKTHAKQGYSLEVSVIFLQNPTKQSTQPIDKSLKPENKYEGDSKQKKSLASKALYLVSLLIVAMAIYSYFSVPTRNYSFNTLTPITSSDNLERNASFSPDGKFILFHRYDGLCDNNIWAKEVATAKEHKLTSTYGFYSDHSFTVKGDKLAFMAKVSCKKNKRENEKEQEKKQKGCWNLMTLDFQAALKQSQQPELIVSCDQGTLSKPVWLSNGNLVALIKQDSRWNIIKFMPGAPTFVPLYTSNDKNYYHLVYSHKTEQLIVLAINSLNEHLIDIISSQGELVSSHVIDRPESLAPYKMLTPIIDPQQEQLLFSTGKRLFSLSFTGEVKQISTVNHNNLSSIKMNDNGDIMVSVQGIVDTDIAKVNIEDINLKTKSKINHAQAVIFNQMHQPYPSIARSIAEDFDAKYQPKGNLIAFISSRSGVSQLWVQGKEQLRQLTNFSVDTVISNFSWNPSGTNIMVAANSEIFNVSLDKTIEKIPLSFAVVNLFQWQENNDLLMNTRQGGLPQLITYNLTSQQITTLVKREVKWALKTEFEQLLYLDSSNSVWIQSNNKPLPITKLTNQFASPRFIFNNGKIYSINKHKNFWSYTLETDVFKELGTMDSYTNFISDIKQSELLLTQVIAAKKEVVVLSNGTID